MEKLQNLTKDQAKAVRDRFGTPVYVYDELALRRNVEECLHFPNAFGLTVRYAMKASPNANLLRLFDGMGLHFDASSGFECERALFAGIAPEKISLSSQELPQNFAELIVRGISLNACSLRQVEEFGRKFKGGRLGVRMNPGLGSGGTNRTNTGGPAASFGIWHEWMDRLRELVEEFDLKVFRLHTHVGSGGDPEVWKRVARLSLDLVREFPEAAVLNLGGGFRVSRMSGEEKADLADIGRPVRDAFVELADECGRRIHLEVEPGTYLVANSGSLVATVADIVSTGEEGFEFLKLDTGMTEILRPSLYGAQHALVLLSRDGSSGKSKHYVVVGHCCESGDLLTPAPGDSELLNPRELEEAAVGDLCVIEGVGAYCSAMPAKNYNSFPEAPEVLLRETGESVLIRKRQTLAQILENELRIEG